MTGCPLIKGPAAMGVVLEIFAITLECDGVEWSGVGWGGVGWTMVGGGQPQLPNTAANTST